MGKCELCGIESDNVWEHDDCDGRPHLVCDYCWENLGNEEYEPNNIPELKEPEKKGK